ncbi:MAG: galactokinase [Acidobacteriota bacterium]
MTKRFWAPGRVNLIGEHTDYNDGYVMPVAIELGTTVSVTPAETMRYTTATAAPAGWEKYVEGVLAQMRARGLEPPPLALHFESTVPLGAGLSSSAALEVSTALALLEAVGVEMPLMDVARLCQQAEVETVGLGCGIMDMFISLHGREGQAMLLDCRTLEYKAAPIPADIAMVIADTGVRHELAGSEYNTRKRECAEAARALGVSSLRDAVEDGGSKRARHVIGENRRVVEFAAALAANDRAAMGELMAASHASLRDDYEVSCRELDELVECAARCPGVIGSRMTGGGFGGSTINLVEERQTDEFVAALERLWPGARLRVSRASGGARRIQ